MLLKKSNKFLLFLKNAYLSIKRYKKLIAVFLVIYFLSFWLGYIFVGFKTPLSINIKKKITLDLSENKFFLAIIGEIKQKHIFKAIFLTFLFNLIWGAFISTTLVGLIFFFPFLLAFLRGFLVGVAFSENLFASFYYFGVVFITMIFEFLAYGLSSSYGVILGTSFLFPQKFGKLKRKEALFQVIKEFPYFYFFVGVLLLLGAIWEISGIIKLVEVFKNG